MSSNAPSRLRNIIQVAGIKDAADAQRVRAAGVEWLGFPLRLDVHAPDLTEAAAARLITGFDPEVKPVVITYLADAKEIDAFLRTLGTRYVQLHGPITAAELRKLRGLRPDAFVIKSLVVGARDEGALRDDVSALAGDVDAFITDTFDPATGASGATGKTHDWRVSRELVSLSPRPVILAGGLNPGNVREAIRAVRPAGVDVHTGIEDAAGNKDARLTLEFVAAARAGFGDLANRQSARQP